MTSDQKPLQEGWFLGYHHAMCPNTATCLVMPLAVLLALTCLAGDADARRSRKSAPQVSAEVPPPPAPPEPRRSLKAPPEPGKPTRISIGYYILNLGRISQVEETFDIAGLVTTSWLDPRLKFDPAEVGESVMRYAPDQIWIPELTIVNTANLQRRTPIQLSVSPDGRVKWIEFIAVTVSSDFDLRNFPFDAQTAYLLMEPLSFSVQPLELSANPEADGIARDSYVGLSEWKILSVHSDIIQKKSRDGAAMVPRFSISMQIKRNYGFYLFKVALPLLLITIISWTAFWISPSTAFASQMSVQITSILAAITFNLTVTSALPRVPYTTLMDLFIALCYLFFFASILAVVDVHYVVTQGDTERALRILSRFRWMIPLLFTFAQTISAVSFLVL